MSITQHPQIDQLITFAEKPEDENLLQIALHVANCAICRKSVSSIRLVLENISELIDEQVYSGDSAFSDDMIEDFISGNLDDKTKDDLHKTLSHDAVLTKRVVYSALHYKRIRTPFIQ